MAGREGRLGVAGAVSRLVAIVLLSALVGALVGAMALPFVGVAGATGKAVAKGVADLPASLTTRPLGERSRVLDRRGRLLASFYDQYRIPVPLAQVAPIMRRAQVAIEDSRFYQHGALDVKGTLRAFVTNQTAGGTVQGGSSITQQLVKMTLLNQARTKVQQAAATADTYHRKLVELRYALALEQHHSKSWILQRYLNTAYYGDGAYGVEAAARHYFSRPAARLTLAQAALLAGLVKNPTGYDPTAHAARARSRRAVVLDRMAQLHVITPAQARRAEASPLGLRVTALRNGCVSSKAPFFCDYVRQYLLHDDALGKTVQQRAQLLRSGGLTIRTTLDMRMQRAALRAVRTHVHATDRAVGALALVEPGTGDVRAIAQSRPMGGDKQKGQTFLDYAVPKKYGDSSGFQAGSTFKAFVLSAAIKEGIPLRTRIKAPPQVRIPVSRYTGCHGHMRSTDVWNPHNYTGSGTFDLFTGTEQSVNTFFAKLELRTGVCLPYRLAEQMGVRLTDPDNQQVPAFTLGVVDTNPLTMAAAYATFAARGVHCFPRPVTRVVDSHGRVLGTHGTECNRVLTKGQADAVDAVLRGVQEPGGFGYGAGLALEQPSAAKTGTTDSGRAVWFMGYTPNLVTASMIAGVNRQGHWTTLNGQVIGGHRVYEAAGSLTAGPMWAAAMKVAQKWLPDEDFTAPPARLVGKPPSAHARKPARKPRKPGG
ncbi:MAG: transglycosylase domain-containing protein [Nocardioidaceae bacterium]